MKILRFFLIVAFLLSTGSFPASAVPLAVPEGVVINSATLSIYVSEAYTQEVSVHRITAGWLEAEVTWNSFAGAYDSDVFDSFAPVVGWNTVDMLSLVQGWVDGDVPNHGVLLSHDTPVESSGALTAFRSSEHANPDLRPRLEICYTIPGSSETCTTIVRAGGVSEDVFDTTIQSNYPTSNYGGAAVLYARNNPSGDKQVLLQFDIPIEQLTPGVELVKYTNGEVASDPNGSDVPHLRPGEAVVWTYRITNTGETSVPRDEITVTDNQPGVTPAFDEEVDGDGDAFFEPGEVWDYTAVGTAVDLQDPPDGVITVPDACTVEGTEEGATAYVNQGMVNIPGDTDTAESSYCNGNQPGVELVKYTNGEIASDPNGSDVPRLRPGDPVVWTYRITNTGETSVPQDEISVTDNQPGVTPAFDREVLGDGDTLFEPDEVWDYTAVGTAVDLQDPPDGMITIPDACAVEETEPGVTAYVNQGTVTIPGDEDTAESHYCNEPESGVYKHWIPMAYGSNILIEPEDFQVFIGFEDLPLRLRRNDFDYNDWVVEITFSVRRLASNPDLIDQIVFDFIPSARGSIYSHTFSMVFPANTFPSNGTSTMRLLDPSLRVIRSTTAAFTGSSRSSIEIFANSSNVYPVNQTNTFENRPIVQPLQTASLVIDFETPVAFSTSDFSITEPHGAGLFFEPQIRVLNTGDVIGQNDLRMLSVPQFQSSDVQFYMWPEEYVRIDSVYTQTVFHTGNPPVIDFPENWWTERNNCAFDGIPCILP